MKNRGIRRLGWALALIAGLVLAATPAGVDAGDEPQKKRRAATEERLDDAERKVKMARAKYQRAREALDAARGAHAGFEKRLDELEEELVSLRRRGGSEDDKHRIEIAIEKTRADIEERRAKGGEGATRKRIEKMEAAAGKQAQLLRRAEEHFVKVRDRLKEQDYKFPEVPADHAEDRKRRVNQLEAEVRDLRKQLAATESAADGMNPRLRERIELRAEQAREEAEELRAALRAAEEDGLGEKHVKVVRLRRDIDRAHSRIRAMEEQLADGGVPEAAAARRSELARAIEVRMKAIRTVMALKDGERKKGNKKGGKRNNGDLDMMATQIERLGKAVERLHDIVERHHGQAPATDRKRPRAPRDGSRDEVVTRMKQMQDHIAKLEAENARLSAMAAEADATRRKLLEVQEQFDHLREHGHFHGPGEND